MREVVRHNKSTSQRVNVYTYFEPISYGGDQQELIAAWGDSWRRMGWNPVVLTQEVASKHPDWVSFNAGKRHTLPSRNPEGYDAACWHRWFAFAVIGGGVMVDYDVINMGLSPEEVIFGPPLILEQHRVPCAVCCNQAGSVQIVRRLMDHLPQPVDGHWSDMLFFQCQPDWLHIKTCCEPGQGNWRTAKLLHFSARACHELGANNKCQAIYQNT